MEERRHPVLTLEDAAIAAALAPLGGAQRVREATLLGGGFSNTNYRVDRGGLDAPVVLRLYAGGAEVCRKETALLLRLRGRVPVPAVLHAAPDGGAIGVPYAVLAWVDGVSMSVILQGGEEEAITQCAEAAGRTLAAIHTMTFPAAGFFGPDLVVAQPMSEEYSWRGYLTACVEAPDATQRLGADLAHHLKRLVEDDAAEMDAASAPAILVHGDYQGKNLLMRRVADAWQVAGVLDWEFAFAGSPLFDLGILLRHADTLPAEYGAAVARGYAAAGGTLPEEWLRRARLNDLVNLCEFLLDGTPRPVHEAAMCQLIAATVRRYGSATA